MSNKTNNEKNKNIFIVLVYLIIGKEQYKEFDHSKAEKFLRSLYTAATCRFVASARLKINALVSFTTTTILSLGLILIPLFQITHLKLAFSEDVLLMIQIFLAVSILVYSIINSKARFNIRAEKLNACGNKIKKVARDLEMALDKTDDKKAFDFNSYHIDYLNIETDIENHTQFDYFKARIKMPYYYEISGFKKLILFVKSYASLLLTHIVSLIIMGFEFLIISDALGITSFISPLLNGLAGNR